MRRFTQLPPLSLYVHIPWCERKCPYCDFNSHQQREPVLPEQTYVDALLADLELELPDIWGRQIISIFIGGGTPSLFSAAAIETLLNGIRARTGYPPNIEVTMEANPGSVEYARFAEYRAAGVNRLSIGIQSFNDASLQELGRIHSAAQAHEAAAIAHKAGFDNINLDLMFGLPQQSNAMASADLTAAIALEPQHISYYQLTLEPNTYFAKYPPQLPSSDALWQQHAAGIDQLEVHGYKRYEVSAFAQANKQCQHNLNYWLFGDYVGIGAGAHGKLSFAHKGTVVRRWKVRHPTQYIDCAGTAQQVGGTHIVPEHESGIEFMMNALRLIDGFPLSLYPLNTGCDLHPVQSIIDEAITDGLLTQLDFHLRPTERGINFLNELLERFVPEDQIASYPIIPVLDKTRS